MATTAEVRTKVTTAGLAAGRPWRDRLLVAAVIALVASPVVVAALALVGEPWYPVGDFAHMVFRTSQVGTSDTPLVGAYTTKGWAHPGPLLFWLSAPLYRLMGEDPRAVEWTTATINVACITALGLLAWRRGRWPLLVTLGAFTGLLLYGLGPELLVSVWNPFVPLLPFFLTVLLVWDAALGRRRSLLWAVIPASIAMQGHVAFVILVVVLAVWLWAWCRWWPRLLDVDPGPGSAEVPTAEHDRRVAVDGDLDRAAGVSDEELTRPPWRAWYALLRRGVIVAVVLWIGPLVDAVVDLHNPVTILKGLATPPAAVGPVNAVGLVGRYVRPDGPWVGGAEPTSLTMSVQGSGPLPFLLAVAVVVGCLQIARRRRLVDLAALASLTLVLLLTALPATSQIVLPAFHYLTQWLKIIGCLVWLTAAWTAWLVAAPYVRAAAGRQTLAAGIAGAALLAAVAISWGDASALEQPHQAESVAVQELRHQLADVLPRDRRMRVESRGDYTAIANPGLIYWLIEDGHDVVTRDGFVGLKWGHEHRWERGDDYDMFLTIARNKAALDCADDPEARRLAYYDALTPEERAWYDGVQFRQFVGAEDVTDAELARARELAEHDLRIGVFAGRGPCAEDPRWKATQPTDASVVPVLAGTVAALAGAGAVVVVRRRRSRSPRRDRRGSPST